MGSAETYYVDVNAANPSCCNYSYCGTPPYPPLCTIQDGINATQAAGDVVVVSGGTYTGDENRGLWFPPFSWQVPRHITVRCADGETCIIDCEQEDRGFEFYHVDVGATLGRDAKVIGFTIRNGLAGDGGGIWIDDTDPTIQDCVIENCTANQGGGISAIKNAAPLIERCEFKDNHANINGGGIFFGARVSEFGISLEIDGCTLDSNTSGGDGAGIYVRGALVGGEVIKNTVIMGNVAEGKGGGIAARYPGANIKIANCLIVGNSAGDFGGGLSLEGGGLGSLLLEARLVNNVFAENSAPDGGGAYFQGSVWAEFVNSTVANNTATSGTGGGIRNNTYSSMEHVVDNMILWGNTPKQISASTTGITVAYTDIQGGCAGIANVVCGSGNIDSDPLFVDPDGPDNIPGNEDDNYRFSTDSSPCSDAGDDVRVPEDYANLDDDTDLTETTPFDMDLAVRIFAASVDMGAYEYPGCPVATINVAASNPANGTIDARVPFMPPWNNSLERRRGIGGRYGSGPQIEPITLTLSPARSLADRAACWKLCETGIETIDPAYPQPPLEDNFVYSVVETSPGVYDILLDRPISAGHWTTIAYLGDDSYVSYASLPADANGDQTSAPPDIIAVINYLNGVSTSPWGIYSEDIDHWGYLDFFDTYSLIDLLNGAYAYTAWIYVQLPDNTCPGGESAMAMLPGSGISADEANALFIDGFVDYLTGATLSDREAKAAFELIADGLTDFSLEWLSRGELKLLGEALLGPSLSYATPAAAAKARKIASELSK